MAIRWKRLTKPRFIFVYPVFAALFTTAHITEVSLRVGVALIVLGEVIRFWANGYVGLVKVNSARQHGKVGRLVTVGPYAFVRHPLYLGTLLIGAGFCLAVNSLWVGAAALIGFLASYHHKMSQEETLLLQEVPEYAGYHAAVPRLLPRLRPYPHGHGIWSWKAVAVSKEYKTAIWLVIVAISLYLWEESVQEGKWLFAERPAYRAFLCGLVVALAVAEGVIELLSRQRAARGRASGSAVAQ